MKKTTANNLRDYPKCQSLAVVHITVLRLTINGSETDKQENSDYCHSGSES